MKTSKKPQTILVTGISGSGKTENGKHLIEFLAHASNLQTVSDSSPILEAFGNAKTEGNENSSRFCKHIEVTFISMYLESFDRFNQMCPFTFTCIF